MLLDVDLRIYNFMLTDNVFYLNIAFFLYNGKFVLLYYFFGLVEKIFPPSSITLSTKQNRESFRRM